MPRKTKSGETQMHPVVAEALTLGTASGRTRRPALSPNPAKRKATEGLRTRASRRSGSASPSALTEAPKYRSLVDSPGAPAVLNPMPQEVKPALKGGTRKKAAADSVVSGKSPSVKDRSRSKPARAAALTPRSQGAAGLHPETTSTADGNGHFDHYEIARLAYSYWEARGYQGGSPEEDWYRAQTELRQRRQQPTDVQPCRRARKAQPPRTGAN
jgi:hypothetical protein